MRGHAHTAGPIHPRAREPRRRVLPLHRARDEPAEPEIEAGQPAQDAVADRLRQGSILGNRTRSRGSGKDADRDRPSAITPPRRARPWLRAIPRPHLSSAAVARRRGTGPSRSAALAKPTPESSILLLLREWNKLRFTGHLRKAALLPVALGLLHPCLRAGHEVPPDMPLSIHWSAAQEHNARG